MPLHLPYMAGTRRGGSLLASYGRPPAPVALYGRCGSWMPEEWRMCAASLKSDGDRSKNRYDLVLSGGEFFAQRYEEPRALSAYGGRSARCGIACRAAACRRDIFSRCAICNGYVTAVPSITATVCNGCVTAGARRARSSTCRSGRRSGATPAGGASIGRRGTITSG